MNNIEKVILWGFLILFVVVLIYELLSLWGLTNPAS
jgi:hypothetical protein